MRIRIHWSTRHLVSVVTAVALALGYLATHDVRLGRTVAMISITIRVVDDGLNPVEGAQVKIVESDINCPEALGYSDVKGEFRAICKISAVGHEGPFFLHYKKLNYYHTITINHNLYENKEGLLTEFMKDKTYFDNRFDKKPIIIKLKKIR